jgi:hypothetical protein
VVAVVVVASTRRRVSKPRTAFGRVAFAYTQHIIIIIIIRVYVFEIIIYYTVLRQCGGKKHRVIYRSTHVSERILAVLLMIYTTLEPGTRVSFDRNQWRPVKGDLET